MHLRDHPATPAALLLVCIAAHYTLFNRLTVWPRDAAASDPVRLWLPAPGSSARRTLDWCEENVAIVHDVYWAGACATVATEQRRRRVACGLANVSQSTAVADPECAPGLDPPDDSPDCTLPDERARPLNVARANAEQQCLDQAMAGERTAGR